jgi:ubiquinone/menaquinone biosynthesis C-methylase UbiE
MPTAFVPAFNFEVLTPFYDVIASALGFGKARRTHIVDLLHLRQGELLLDVGCGTSALLIAAKTKHPDVLMTGIDVDEKILALAERNIEYEHLKIELTQAEAGDLPFEDDSFDVIVSSLVFHHLSTAEKKQALDEIYRVLMPKGRFLFVDFGEKQGALMRLMDLLERTMRLPESETIQDNFQGRIPRYLQEAGFYFRQEAPRYRGVEFLMATKAS